MKRIIHLFIFISLAVNLSAQKSPKRILRLANNEMANLKYAYAIPLYKTYLLNGGKDSTVFIRLGMAYQMVNQYDSALKYTQIAASYGQLTGSTIPELQASVGDYTSAKKGYAAIVSKNKTLLSDARLYGFSNVQKFYTDSLDYQIFYTKINTPFNEYNAVPYQQGLLFESNRVYESKNPRHKGLLKKLIGNVNAWDGNAYTSLYYLTNTKDIKTDSVVKTEWKEIPVNPFELSRAMSNDNRKMDIPLEFSKKLLVSDTTIHLFKNQYKGTYNVGAISFTKDLKTAYYTKNGKKTNKGYLLEIWETKFVNGKWSEGKRLFFNNPNYSYFHPAVTPDGARLYYVTDEPTGFGGTDIYYIDKNEDGSWKSTTNAGQLVNTTGNELFPSFYEGVLFFSSNGHPGLGGLDIYRLAKDIRGELSVKNMGYPINSSKDDLGLSMIGNKGYFSSNRFGSDDIFAFDYAPVYLQMNGKVNVDSVCVPGKKVYLTQKDELGRISVVDSAIVDQNCAYSFKVRPNKAYTLTAYDISGNKFEAEVASNQYVKEGKGYVKNVDLINIPLSEKELAAKLAKETALRQLEQSKMTTVFARAIDSLKALTKDYVELHHPFDQVYIVQKDLADYYKLIERVKRMKGKEIVVVSATDCNGSDEYNEDLSQRRAIHIYKTLSALSNNKVIIKHVGERELLKACDDLKKSIEEQVVNRYSYVFIIDKY
jgi:outer membrane protein OmpA-like peptidoglycan-associated protein